MLPRLALIGPLVLLAVLSPFACVSSNDTGSPPEAGAPDALTPHLDAATPSLDAAPAIDAAPAADAAPPTNDAGNGTDSATPGAELGRPQPPRDLHHRLQPESDSCASTT